MHFRRFFHFMMALMFSSLAGLASESETVRLKATIEQWMEVMRDIQEEEQRWVRESQVLQDEKEGLESELAQLEEDLMAVQGRLDSADQASQDKLEEKRSFDAARELLAQELDGLETLVLSVVPLVPDFFVDESSKLKKAIEQLEKHSGTEDKTQFGLNARLSPLVHVLTEIERFNQKIWPQQVQIDVGGGKEKLMKVVYFGLGAAYAVDSDATIALLGRPGASGWNFEPLEGDGVPARVRDLIAAADNSGISQMVELPLEFSK